MGSTNLSEHNQEGVLAYMQEMNAGGEYETAAKKVSDWLKQQKRQGQPEPSSPHFWLELAVAHYHAGQLESFERSRISMRVYAVSIERELNQELLRRMVHEANWLQQLFLRLSPGFWWRMQHPSKQG